MIAALAILLAILLVLVTLAWAGAARRAAMLTDRLATARMQLRLANRRLIERPEAEIIQFPKGAS